MSVPGGPSLAGPLMAWASQSAICAVAPPGSSRAAAALRTAKTTTKLRAIGLILPGFQPSQGQLSWIPSVRKKRQAEEDGHAQAQVDDLVVAKMGSQAGE